MLSEYWKVLRRNWPVAVAVTLLTAMAALGVSFAKKPTYEATAVMYVSLDKVQSVTDLTQGASYVLDQMKAYESVVVSPQVTQPVIDNLKLSDTTDDLASRISASTTTDSTVMEVTCTSDAPQEAADICNQVATQFQKRIPSLATFEVKRMGTLKAEVLTPATAPLISSAPSRSTLLTLGLLAGVPLGVIAAILVDRLRNPVANRRAGQTTA